MAATSSASRSLPIWLPLGTNCAEFGTSDASVMMPSAIRRFVAVFPSGEDAIISRAPNGRAHPDTLVPRREKVIAMSKGKTKSAPKALPKYRSAVTGHYVSPQYAKTHPKTTVKESK